MKVGEVNVSVGEYISLTGNLENINVNGNFWELDFNSYLLNRNVKYKIIDSSIRKLNFYSIQYFLFKIINSSNNLSKLLLFQQKTDDPIYNNLNSYSLGYLINLSGLNIYIISNFLNKKLFDRCQIYKKYKIVLIILLFYYSYLLNFKLFILKSAILLIINWIELNWKFKFSRVTKLSILWIACLFINPLFIFNIGFIFTLIAFLFIKKYTDKKPITNIFYNFLIINVVFAPVQIFYYYKYFWFSSIFKVLLIPIITFSFTSSLFFMIPFLKTVLNLIYQLLYFFSKSLTYINLTTICGSFSFLFLIAYFTLFILISHFKFSKKILKLVFISLFSLNIFLIFELNQFSQISPSITMLNVGNGNSFLFQYKNRTILFDAGKGSGFNKNSLEQFLIYKGIRKIEAVFISHNHKDHYDQLESVKNSYKVKNIFFNYNLKTNYIFQDLKITNFIELNNNDENNNSQISLLEIANKKILFTGDATKKREYRLVKNEVFLTKIKGGIDFLQVGHHGSKTSTSEKFIEIIKPKTCYISGHKSKTLNFPNKETIETLNKYKCQTYVTNGTTSYKYKIKNGETFKI
ncbi:ComEC/Rec2 family competence protein [Spiroplasma floricola]|uniref:ComEC/Rec2 family competence protein n=1 Tax=Spiroplasma floricola TaxID=216937 RepID=UPI0012FE2318|nr:ComEC/Rec2 family competence protein [Spiroplasma floricola]